MSDTYRGLTFVNDSPRRHDGGTHPPSPRRFDNNAATSSPGVTGYRNNQNGEFDSPGSHRSVPSDGANGSFVTLGANTQTPLQLRSYRSIREDSIAAQQGRRGR